MKKIRLNQKNSSMFMFALVDDGDFEKLNKYYWYYGEYADGKGYAKSYNPTKQTPKLLRMHRIIMNAPKGVEVDHINGDGLDNRKKNLRLASHSQNNMNKKAKSNNKSGYKGVCWDKKSKKWLVQISKNKKRVYMGRFHDLIQAAKIYNKMALKYHGKFAYLNKC